MSFNHLNLPETWQEYFSKYPNGLSLLEALIQWVSQVDDMVDVMNNWTNYLESFTQQFDAKLQSTVETTLQEWIASGFFQVIIDQVIGDQMAEVRKSAILGGSYVDKASALIAVRGMYLIKRRDVISVGVGMNDSLNSVVEYGFKYNDDNILLLKDVRSGVGNAQTIESYIPATLTGTFIQTSAPQTYTTTIGDSFSQTFTGAKQIAFERRMEPRGGAWLFKIVGPSGEARERRVMTCYSLDSITKVSSILWSDLSPFETYTVTATFIGNDPLNTPSSSPSRGYINFKTGDYNNQPIVRKGIVLPLDNASAKYLLSSTIVEFAFHARKAGATYPREWVPQHAGVSGVSLNPFIKINLDGFDVASVPGVLPSYTYIEIDQFEVDQIFKGNNPNGSDGALFNHTLHHTISRNNPVLKIQNAMTFLQDTDVDLGYLSMLASRQSNMFRLVLNNGEIIQPIPVDGSETTKDLDVSSMLFVGEYNPGSGNFHAIAVDNEAMREACNLGNNLEPSGDPVRITYRSDDIVKVYFNNIINKTVPSGTRLRNQTNIIALSGVRFPNEYLKSIY